MSRLARRLIEKYDGDLGAALRRAESRAAQTTSSQSQLSEALAAVKYIHDRMKEKASV